MMVVYRHAGSKMKTFLHSPLLPGERPSPSPPPAEEASRLPGLPGQGQAQVVVQVIVSCVAGDS